MTMTGQNTVPKRIYITLPDTVAADVERWAGLRGQAVATATAIAVELCMQRLKETGELPLEKSSEKS